jgi:hypothetical protein
VHYMTLAKVLLCYVLYTVPKFTSEEDRALKPVFTSEM